MEPWNPPGHFYWRRPDGLRQHVVDCGSGPPVFFLHGNPTWSFYWRALIEACRDSHRCIAPDWIGMGRSDKPGDDRYRYTLQSHLDDLEALYQYLVRERGLPPGGITLAVHDWGGMIGLAWAARHPQRIARLIITNTAAFPNPRNMRLPLALWLCRNTALGALLVRGLNAFARGASYCATVNALPTAVRREYCAPYDSWAHRIATLRFVQDIPLTAADPAWAIVQETRQRLPLLADKPTWLGWGLRDFVFDRPFYETFCRFFPGAQRRAWEQAGHYLLEDAASELIPEVCAFLRQTAVAEHVGA